MRELAIATFVATAGCALAPDTAVQQRVAQVDAARLMAHVEALCAIGPRPAGNPAATEATLRYLEHELAGYGYQPRREGYVALTQEWRQRGEADGAANFDVTSKVVPHHNLIAEKPGHGPDAVFIELGAHYDTVAFGPGADDNASGTAALLEVARLLFDVPTTKAIRFVFFAQEEEGLVGSRKHVEHLLRDGALPEGALTLDMVGYATSAPDSQRSPVRIPLLLSLPSVGDFVLVAGNHASGWLGNLHEAAIDAYLPGLRYYSLNRLASWFDDAARTDQWNYWQAGIPAIALGDTADSRNPNYHQPTDTPATLDPTFLRHNAQAVLATMLHWAEPQPAQTR